MLPGQQKRTLQRHLPAQPRDVRLQTSTLTSDTRTTTDAEQADAQKPTAVAAVASEAVVLEVGSMKCGGCSAAVKRILMACPEVDSAAVNLLTETAAVRFKTPGPGAPAGGAPPPTNATLAGDVAQLLTKRGFPARVRPAAADGLGVGGDDQAALRRQAAARASLVDLGLAGALLLATLGHHAGHFLHMMGAHEMAHSPLLTTLGSPLVSGGGAGGG